jgi:hypothetical protein
MTLLYCHLCPPELQKYMDNVVELYQKRKLIGVCCEFHSEKVHKQFEGLSDEQFKLAQEAFQEARASSIRRYRRICDLEKAIEKEEEEYEMRGGKYSGDFEKNSVHNLADNSNV